MKPGMDIAIATSRESGLGFTAGDATKLLCPNFCWNPAVSLELVGS